MLSHHNRQTLEISVAYHDKGSFLAHVTSDVGQGVLPIWQGHHLEHTATVTTTGKKGGMGDI